MTQLLEKVLNEVYKLSVEQQNAIAVAILEQLQDEKLWEAVMRQLKINLLNWHTKFGQISRGDE